MKHSIKSWIALLLCLLLVVPMVMTACKKKTDEPTDSTTAASDESTTDSQDDGTDGTDGTDDTNDTNDTSDTDNSDETTGGGNNNNNNNNTDNNNDDDEEEEAVVDETVLASGVSLSSVALTMTKGTTSKLVAFIAPMQTTDKTLTWTTSDAAVVTVADGTLTALKAGTATVTVATANGKTATCAVTVTEEASAITLNKTSLWLYLGGTDTLTASTAVTWTSSDPTVATVDKSGKIVAVGWGTAVILATNADATKSAVCTVRVVENSLSFNTLGASDTLANTLVATVAKGVTTFDFATEINRNGNIDFAISANADGSAPFDTKTVSLLPGENTFYLVEKDADKNTTEVTYTIVISRDTLYTLTLDVGDGMLPDGIGSTMSVNHGAAYTLPTPTKTGYSFEGWFYNTTPIDLTGTWSATEDDATLVASFSVASYTLTLTTNVDNVADLTGGGSVEFESTANVTASAPKLRGYVFDGWYDGTEKLSADLSYAYTMGGADKTLTACYVPVAALAPFTFTATETEVAITGVSDTTVSSVTIPSYVTSINVDKLIALKGLSAITVEAGNTVYESAGNCLIDSATDTILIGLATSTIPEDGSVTKIAANAFKNRSSLIKLTVPASITEIADGAFAGCTSLLEIYNKSTLTITEGDTGNGGIALFARNVYTTEGGSKIFVNNATQFAFFNDGTSVSLVGYVGTETDLTIPETVTIEGVPTSFTIADGALAGLPLTKLTLPSLTEKFYTLFGSAASDVPATLTEVVILGGDALARDAFKDCVNITTVTVNANLSKSNIFSGCSALTTVILGANVDTIASRTFSGTNLQSLTLASYDKWKPGTGTAVVFTGPEDAAQQIKNSTVKWTYMAPSAS